MRHIGVYSLSVCLIITSLLCAGNETDKARKTKKQRIYVHQYNQKGESQRVSAGILHSPHTDHKDEVKAGADTLPKKSSREASSWDGSHLIWINVFVKPNGILEYSFPRKKTSFSPYDQERIEYARFVTNDYEWMWRNVNYDHSNSFEKDVVAGGEQSVHNLSDSHIAGGYQEANTLPTLDEMGLKQYVTNRATDRERST